MDQLLAALPGLVGVLVGVFASRFNDSSRAKREREDRWVAQVQTICSELIALSHEFGQLLESSRITWKKKVESAPASVHPDEYEEEIRAELHDEYLQPLILRARSLTSQLQILDAGPIYSAADGLAARLNDAVIDSTNRMYGEWDQELYGQQTNFVGVAKELAKNPTKTLLKD